MRRGRWALTLAALALATSGCSEPGSTAADDWPEEAYIPSATEGPAPRYVAMGDSTASGMGIPYQVGPAVCRRSSVNYASLIVERWEIEEAADVTCMGTSVSGITGPMDRGNEGVVPAQVDALAPTTELVTIAVGANDISFLGYLGEECRRAARRSTSPTPCADLLRAEGKNPISNIDLMAERLRGAFEVIRERAPAAELVVVGYASLGGKHGPCRQMPLTPADFDLAERALRYLNDAIRAAAAEHDAHFIDLYEIGSEHGACAPEPWVNGMFTDGDGALGHPRAVLHRHIADRVSEKMVELGWQQ